MEQDICISCHMCCDGTLFGYVEVTPEEQARLGGGDDFSVVGGRLAMRQRCARLGQDGACARYADRPAKCAAFRCKLLKKFRSGDVDADFARLVIDEARQMERRASAQLTELLPQHRMPDGPPNARRLMYAAQDAVDAGEIPEGPRFALAKWTFLAATMLLREHFHDPEKPGAV